MHLLPASGPRNAPLPLSAWLVAAAWLQLGLALAAAAYVGVLVWALWLYGPISAAGLAELAALQAVPVLGAIGAVAVTRRAGPGAAIASLVIAFALLVGADAFLWLG